MNTAIEHYFKRAAEATLPALSWHAQTSSEHRAWRRRFADRLDKVLGVTPERVNLSVRWRERVDIGGVIRHKIYVRSEADYWAPAYYFVPENITAPRPAIVCLHGHSGILPYIDEGTDAQRAKAKAHELDYAVRFARAGYITVAIIQRGWNETALPADQAKGAHSCYRVSMDAFLIGTTPVRLRTWDASRIIDFLETQDVVDSDRIAVAGLSGGGTTGLFLTAVEPRLKAAMIAGYYCTFRDSIFSIHHCICNCVPDIMRWGEMRDVAALFAPKPMLIISGIHDPIFPIKATRRAYRELGRVYDCLDARKNLESDFFDGPHSWSNNKTDAFLKKRLPLPQ